MKTIHSFDMAGNPKSFAAETPMPFAVTVTRLRKRTRDSLLLSEIIPLWFAISSPLIGVVLGFLGAWFVTWLTS